MLKLNGKVYCWGNDENGQLGNGSTGSTIYPGEVRNLSDVVQVSAGALHACALTQQGRIACWGSRLGHSSEPNSHVPVWVSGENYVQVSSGGQHTCGLRSNGKVYCWGESVSVRVVNAKKGGVYGSARSTPHVAKYVNEKGGLSDISGIVQISSGGNHSCALTSKGNVRCWGRNSRGQLGIGEEAVNPNLLAKNELVRDTSGNKGSLLQGVVQVSSGLLFTCALKDDGTVNCWGYENLNYLGNGGDSSPYPSVVRGTSANSSLRDVVQIDSGFYNSCALKQNGSLICWGDYSNGALGEQITGYVSHSIVIKGIPKARGVSVGYSTCALMSAGNIKCWGNNTYAQLGHGGGNKIFGFPMDVLSAAESSRFNAGADGGRYACQDNAGHCALSGVLLSLDSGRSTTNETSPLVNVTGLKAGETISLYSDNTCLTELGRRTSSGSVTLTGAISENEEFLLYARVDGASFNNNVCFKTGITLDTVLPEDLTVSELSPADSTQPQISGTGGIPDDTIKIYLNDETCSDDAALAGEATVRRNNSWSVDTNPNYIWEARTISGRVQVFYFYAKSVDPSGNESACSAGEYQTLVRP